MKAYFSEDGYYLKVQYEDGSTRYCRTDLKFNTDHLVPIPWKSAPLVKYTFRLRKGSIPIPSEFNI